MQCLLGQFIYDKTSQNSSISLMLKIFGTFQDKRKDAQSISSNCLFEFRNGLNMSNIATLFKISHFI